MYVTFEIMKSNKIHILLKDKFGETLNTRENVKHLFAKFKEDSSDENIVLDFTDVIFMSRSFADQLVKAINSSNFQVELMNMNLDIQEMYRIVQRTQKNNRNIEYKLPILRFSTQKQLENYLWSI